jgi:hypothetical protein
LTRIGLVPGTWYWVEDMWAGTTSYLNALDIEVDANSAKLLHVY